MHCKNVLWALCLAATAAGTAYASNWSIKQGPMMTTWSESIDPTNVMPEYPRPQMQRGEWLNLNGLWELRKGIVGEPYSATFTYDKEILVPFPIESALSGVMEKSDEQCYWYHRTVKIPKSMRDRNILLHFGAVDWETVVYVNGTKVGRHTGGYDPFYFDITSALNSGEEQDITVYVYDNTGVEGQPTGKQSKNPSICWYTAVSGIWQTVWLEPVSPAHIADFEIEPNLDQKWLRIKVNPSVQESGLTFNAVIKDNDGKTVASVTGGTPSTTSTIQFGNEVHAWSPDDPYLYDMELSLVKNGKTVDKIDSYCAMRKIEVKKDNNGLPRIYLNNEQIFQMGPLDQGWWPDGLYAAPCDEALLYDVQVMKSVGFNMVRKHIKTEPARWYYHCDREGLLVWQDLPSPNLPKGYETVAKANFEDEAHRIVNSLKNYPSIVQWIVFNEGWGQFDTERMTNLVDGWVNNLVPQRYGKTTLICCASGWTDAEVGNIIDSHSYPQPSCPYNANRAAVCGEYGGITLKVPGHIWPGGDFQYTTVETGDDFTAFFSGLCDQIKDLYYQGLNAAVYTQISDVEIEKNGIMTYDRKVIKPTSPTGQLRDKIVECINMPQSNVRIKTILSTTKDHIYKWRYTTEAGVPRRWFDTGFDDRQWKTGEAAFGANMPQASAHLVNTPWTTNQIYMRRWFYLGDIDEDIIKQFRFTVFHDDDIEIYINGVWAASRAGCVFNYSPLDISTEALSTLKPNSWNLIAVGGKQGTGQQIMDVGISAYVTADFDYTESFDEYDAQTYIPADEPGNIVKPKFSKLKQEFRHTADRNNVAWGDFDNDGMLEVAYMGYDSHAYSGAGKGFAAIYDYSGDNAFSVTEGAFEPCYYACPVWLDFNNDGLLDLFVPGLKSRNYADNLDDVAAYLYKNLGKGSDGKYAFEEVNHATKDGNLMGIAPIYNDTDGGRGRHWVAVGDYDNDGYQDIIVTGRDDYEAADVNGNNHVYKDRRAVYLYKNDQGKRFIRQDTPLDGKLPFHPLARGSVYFADMDNDGRLDIISSGYGLNEGNLHIYWNNGDGTFSENDDNLYGSYDSSCGICDMDNDGYQDIVVTGFSRNKGAGSAKSFFIYKNNGNRSFAMLNDDFCGFEGVDGATMAIGDVNHDGLADILVGGHGQEHEITTWLYLNRGDFLFEPFGAYYNDPFGKLGSLDRISHGNNHLVDYNGDGKLDLWLMGWAQSNVCPSGCAAQLWENISTTVTANAAPEAPANLRVEYDKATSTATFSWDAPADDATPRQALRYNLYIRKADESNACSMIIPADLSTGTLKTDELAAAIGGTAYRLEIPAEDCDYQWGVQAIDGGKAGGKFKSAKFNPAKSSGIEKKKAAEITLYGTDGTITYKTGPEAMTLSVYDLHGATVKRLTVTQSGIIGGFSSGHYIATLTGKNFSQAYKLSL